MASSAFHHIKTKRNKSSTICGLWKTTKLSTMLWSASVWLSRLLAISHMPYSEVTTQPKSLVAHKASKHSWTIQIGLRHGLLKVRDFIIMEWQFKTQKNNHTQPSSTQVAHSSRFHPASSKNWKQNGKSRSQVWIVKVPSAIHKRHAQI